VSPIVLKASAEMAASEGDDGVGSLRTAQRIPESLRRVPMTVLHPASMTPELAKRCCLRNRLKA